MAPLPSPRRIGVALVASAVIAAPASGASLMAGSNSAIITARTNAAGDIFAWTWNSSAAVGNMVIARDGRTAYVASAGSPTITSFARNPTDGTLGAVRGTSTLPGNGNGEVAITPDGRFVFVVSLSGGTGDVISTLAVGLDGALSATPVAQLNAGSIAPRYPVIAQGGQSLYATSDYGGDWVYMWTINADGSLTAKSPARVSNGDLNGECLTANPDGTSLYAPTRYVLEGGNPVAVRWRVNAQTGQLTTTDTLPPTDSGYIPCAAAVTPDGHQLVVVRANTIRTWSLGADGEVGPLLGMAQGPTGGFPNTEDGAITPDGTTYFSATRLLSGLGGRLEKFTLRASGPAAIADAGANWPDTSNFWGVAVAPAQPPVAVLSQATGRPDAAVRLDASGSTDPDTQIARYDWNFGDGTSARDAGPTPEHTYTQAGEYTARVTLTNTAGCSTNPAGIYLGRMASCVGGPSATAAATVRVAAEAPAGSGASGSTRGGTTGEGPTSPPALRSRFVVRGGRAVTTGTLPTGATSVAQTARTGHGAAALGFFETATSKTARAKCKVVKRAYACTVTLSKGTWTVTTSARGKAGVVAQSSRRVVVRSAG